MIFVINGEPNSGKDSFVEFCCGSAKKVRNISSIDCIRKASKELRMQGDRKFLCELKKFVDYYCDHSFQYLKSELGKANYDVAFVHIREPENIDRFMKAYPFSKAILLIRLEYEDSRVLWAQSDNLVHGYKDYDITIKVKNLDDLRKEAIKLMESI
jgi:hypothetical protein